MDRVKTKYKFLFLIEQFALTDFKMRYSRSLLGYFWSLLNPVLVFVIYYLVFSVFLKFGNHEYYARHLIIGLLVWNFFADSAQSGMRSLYYKESLLTKVVFPRIVIPVSSLVQNTLTFLINLCVMYVVFFILGLKPQFPISLLPVFLQLIIITAGVSFLLSSFFLKFRDLEHIWTIAIQLGFWLTPIIYHPSVLPEKLRVLIYINPISHIVIYFQELIVQGKADILPYTSVSICISIGIFLIGLITFQKQQLKFSEWV